MGQIQILHDRDGAYGYPVGAKMSVDALFEDFRISEDCDDELYAYLCRIPIPAAVDYIAEAWGIEYKYV